MKIPNIFKRPGGYITLVAAMFIPFFPIYGGFGGFGYATLWDIITLSKWYGIIIIVTAIFFIGVGIEALIRWIIKKVK